MKNFKFCTRIGLPILYLLPKFRFCKSTRAELTVKCQNVENWPYWPKKVYVTPPYMAFRVWVTMTFPGVYELKKGWATRCNQKKSKIRIFDRVMPGRFFIAKPHRFFFIAWLYTLYRVVYIHYIYMYICHKFEMNVQCIAERKPLKIIFKWATLWCKALGRAGTM